MDAPRIPRRRQWGNLFLGVAGLMLVAGETLLKPVLKPGLLFVLYWTACMVLTFFAVLIAALDFFAIRRLARDRHKELLREATDGLPDHPRSQHED